MKCGITLRLFLVILVASVVAVASSVLILQWSLGRGFLRYVNALEKDGVARLAGRLEEVYRSEQDWADLRGDSSRWPRLLAETFPDAGRHPHPGAGPLPDSPWPEGPPPGMQPPLPGRESGGPGVPPLERFLVSPGSPHPGDPGLRAEPPRPPHILGTISTRLFVLDADKNIVAGQNPPLGTADLTPLRDQGQIVGYLGFVPGAQLVDDRQLRFLKEQKLAFALVAGLVLLLASGLSWLLAHRLVRPLLGLAAATKQLAAGDFAIRVPVVSRDEVGQLADHFNTLALTLGKNEQARRQWVADISHELRTPLANLRCEIEALQDGVHQPHPQVLATLHGGILRLNLLVDDLYQLAMSDLGALAYRKEMISVAPLVEEVAASYRSKFAAKGVLLTLDLEAGATARVFADPGRLYQLFANLLDNSLKYTDAGGESRLGLTRRAHTLWVDFQDSAPGVAAPEQERLFERLYRVESSRSRATGGAGLGLSICRNIAEAHRGSITAQPSPLGGLWVRVELPLTEA